MRNLPYVWPRQEFLRHMVILGDFLVIDCNAQCIRQLGESANCRCTALREGLRRGVHQYGIICPTIQLDAHVFQRL